jgi:hypothetical protein
LKKKACAFLACAGIICSAATPSERLTQAPLLGISEVSVDNVAVTLDDDSTRFVTFRLRSEGASAVRLQLNDLRLAPGDKVYVYTGDGVKMYGPIEGSGPNHSGAYTSEAIPGSDVVVEWQGGAGSGGDLPFTVESLEPAEFGTDAPTESSTSPVENAAREVRTSLYRGVPVTHEVVDGMAIVEGDIILGRADEMIPATESTARKGVGRSSVAITGSRYRWPNGVMPYVIDPAIADVGRVELAIARWNTTLLGVVKMVPRTTETNYVSFRRVTGTSDCTSYVGMLGYGAQMITVSDSCSAGTLAHEIGHAWGLWHEHAREDRDKHVIINWANIRVGSSHNFNQQITAGDDLGPYDYNSIMHYAATSYSANGKATITTIPAGIAIGQRMQLSGGDIAAIKLLYPPKPAPAGSYVTVRVAGDPNWGNITVDGLQYMAPTTFSWLVGSTHTITAQDFTANGSRVKFVYWNNRAPQTQVFTVPSVSTTVWASYAWWFPLTVTQTGLGTKTMTPVSADGFYAKDTVVNLTATPAAGYCFAGWTGLLALTPANTSVTMTRGYSLAAKFVAGTVTVSSTAVSAPAAGSSALINVTAPSSCYWTPVVQASASWVTLNSSNTVAGSRTLTLNMAPNTTGVERTAQVSIEGNTVVVTQAAI